MENTKVKRTKFRETFAVQKLSPGHKTHTYFDSQKTQIHRTLEIQVHSAIVAKKKKKTGKNWTLSRQRKKKKKKKK